MTRIRGWIWDPDCLQTKLGVSSLRSIGHGITREQFACGTKENGRFSACSVDSATY